MALQCDCCYQGHPEKSWNFIVLFSTFNWLKKNMLESIVSVLLCDWLKLCPGDPGNNSHTVKVSFSCWTYIYCFPLFNRELKADSSERVSPTTSKASVRQEPDVGSATPSPAVIPKLRIKNETLERTVVSQTVSTTFVHVSELRRFIFIMCSLFLCFLCIMCFLSCCFLHAIEAWTLLILSKKMNRKQIALLSCFTNQDHFMEHKCRKKLVLCPQSVTIRQCPFCLQTSREAVILTEGNSENAGTISKLGLLWSGKKRQGKTIFQCQRKVREFYFLS